MAITVISGATIVSLYGQPAGEPIKFTVADGTAIGKGTLCMITDPRTASAGTTGAPFAGIAAADKEADDGSVKLALYTKGIFDLYTDPGEAIAIGTLVAMSGANLIRPAVATEVEGGDVVGKALESSTTAAEQIQVALGTY